MLDSNFRMALVFEDDVMVHFDLLPSLNSVLQQLSNLHNFSILHLSSYNPAGTDGMSPGFHPKAPPFVRFRPTLMMPGVANLLSQHGARHAVRHGVPIAAAGLDMVFACATRVRMEDPVREALSVRIGAPAGADAAECKDVEGDAGD